MSRIKFALGVVGALCVPALAVAAVNLVSFSSGQTISSTAVNGNFSALKTAVESLQSAVAALQTPCPSGMATLGDFCIDAVHRAAAPFDDGAANACSTEGKHLCSGREIYQCDLLDSADSDCGVITDGGGESVWVSDVQLGANKGQQATYNPSDNTVEIVDWLDSYPYFCCSGQR